MDRRGRTNETGELKEYLVQLSIKVIVRAPSEEDAVVYAGEQAQNGAYTETFEWDPTVEFIEEVPDGA